ncbi:MAG: type II CAAX prenyl endopeptidase Rce1 family protein [Leptolyngbyaceae cyanobacterium]
MDSELTSPFPANLRRILLVLISLVVAIIMGSALVASWNEPQVASRLELYQTDLLLQATAWEGEGLSAEQTTALKQNLLGQAPLQAAQKNYESVRETALSTLNKSSDDTAASPRLQASLDDQAQLLDVLDLRLGILSAEQGDLDAAAENWAAVQNRQARGDRRWQTAALLEALWQGTSLPDNSETLLTETLQGWFRTRALAQYYTQTEADAQLAQLKQAEAERANGLIFTLAAVGVFPAVGSAAGIILLLVVLGQRVLRGTDALLAQNRDRGWETPWTAETIWIVVVGGFLFMGQLVVPLLISPLRGLLAEQGIRGQALFALAYYLVMSAGATAVLWFAIRRYRPLPADWFKLKLGGSGWRWGLGGYFVALPIMLGVSVLNQQLWQGQGGSNPLLQTVLEAQDPIALVIFFATASVAAPLFEEFLFRGFLLPSLTRYLSVWGAIAVSSLIFAVAHLSLSEVLPLTVLGMVLGVVYTRSRNLLAPMLLHSAWNSVTMLGLFLLGSSVN